jgi:hypothetical protein
MDGTGYQARCRGFHIGPLTVVPSLPRFNRHTAIWLSYRRVVASRNLTFGARKGQLAPGVFPRVGLAQTDPFALQAACWCLWRCCLAASSLRSRSACIFCCQQAIILRRDVAGGAVQLAVKTPRETLRSIAFEGYW